jgi:phage terminase small subunit
MNQRRTPRNDSVPARTEAIGAAGTVIDPPSHLQLRASDLPFWRAVVHARAHQLWTAADLVYAAHLTRALSDAERLQLAVRTEGDTLTSARGSSVVNPKHFLIDTLVRRSITLSRMLQLSPRGRSTNAARDAESAKRAADEGEKSVDEVDDDDLIPRAGLQ